MCNHNSTIFQISIRDVTTTLSATLSIPFLPHSHRISPTSVMRFSRMSTISLPCQLCRRDTHSSPLPKLRIVLRFLSPFTETETHLRHAISIPLPIPIPTPLKHKTLKTSPLKEGSKPQPALANKLHNSQTHPGTNIPEHVPNHLTT